MHIRRNYGLFDELKQIAHSPPVKTLGILLITAACGVFARAQETNVAPIVDTNLPSAPEQAYAQMTNSLTALTNAPGVVRTLSLQDCIALALSNNLDLQIDRYNPQISLYSLRTAYGAYDPIASFSGQHEHDVGGQTFSVLTNSFGVPVATNILGRAKDNIDTFNSSVTGTLPWGMTYNLQGNTAETEDIRPVFGNSSDTPAQVSGTLTQPLLKNLWIDEPRLTIRVDKNRLKYSQLGLKLNIMTTITQLEQAYYDLIFNRENVLVQEAAAQQTDRLVVENKKKLEVGALAELDLSAAEAQAAQNRAAIITANSQLGTQERKVKAFITDRFPDWADVDLQASGSLTAPRMEFNRQESWRKALAQRPEYLQAKLDAEKEGIQLKFDWNQLFPELNVFGTYGYNGDGTVYSGALYDIQQQNRPFYIVGGQITMPLGNITARNTYKSDKVSLQQFVLTIKRWERDILIAIDNDIGTLRADYDAVQATHAQRLYEELALDAEQKKLDNGKSTTYNVLLVQRDLTSARGSEIQALDTYNKDLAQFSLDEGSTLDRLNIELKVQ